MTFRQFIEQGTQGTINGFGSAGRAGQSPVAPEGPVKQMPTPNANPTLNKIPPSPFNPSSKLTVAKIAPGVGAIDPLKGVVKTPASNFLPGSLNKSVQQTNL